LVNNCVDEQIMLKKIFKNRGGKVWSGLIKLWIMRTSSRLFERSDTLVIL
jgi:hypothetical protein